MPYLVSFDTSAPHAPLLRRRVYFALAVLFAVAMAVSLAGWVAAEEERGVAPDRLGDVLDPSKGDAEDVTLPTGSAVTVVTAAMTGGISPLQADLLDDALRLAEAEGASLLVLRLDTPGGSLEATRDIIKTMLNAPLPIAVWVGPAGARAASAGVFIVAASSFAGMSPQTTIGAATPVTMSGGEVNGTMGRKVKNDILSLVRSLAQRSGRTIEWYEQAVENADSITASEAVMEGVVEVLSDSMEDFVVQAGAHGVSTQVGALRFDGEAVTMVQHDPGPRYRILAWLVAPQVAYFLFLGGVAGLFFEVSNPGAIFPGVTGAILMLLALYAFSVLPTNAAGVLLILLALGLFVLEVFVPSFGLLTIGGLVSLFLGSTILYKEGSGMSLPQTTIIPTVLVLGVIVAGVLYLVGKAQLKRPISGESTMVGKTATVRRWTGAEGRVHVRGELWHAVSESSLVLQEGDAVRIVRVDGLTAVIEPLNTHTA